MLSKMSGYVKNVMNKDRDKDYKHKQAKTKGRKQN